MLFSHPTPSPPLHILDSLMHSSKPQKKVQKQQKQQKQQKRNITTKKTQKKVSKLSPQTPTTTTQPLFNFTPLSTSLSTTRRRFATKSQGDDEQQGDDQGEQEQQQQQQQGGDEETADPVIALQKRVARQSKEIMDLQLQLSDGKMIVEEWQNKTRQLQERVKHEIEEQHNIHDRYKREISDVKKFSVGKFAKGLLEGIDALEAATKATEAALQRSQDENFVKLAEGLRMTNAVFQKSLTAEGIVKFQSLGETVDPNLHFITAQLPHPSAPAGTITHLLKEGYHIHDRVLRPAQVVVAHNPDSV